MSVYEHALVPSLYTFITYSILTLSVLQCIDDIINMYTLNHLKSFANKYEYCQNVVCKSKFTSAMSMSIL